MKRNNIFLTFLIYVSLSISVYSTTKKVDFAWFQDGILFSTIHQNKVVSAHYFAAGDSRLRTLDIKFKIKNLRTGNTTASERINFFKLLESSGINTESLKVKNTNFTEVLPKGIILENNLIFSVNHQLFKLPIENKTPSVLKPFSKFKQNVLDFFIYKKKLHVITEEGWFVVKKTNSNQQITKWHKQKNKTEKAHAFINEKKGLGVVNLLSENGRFSNTVIIDLNKKTIIKPIDGAYTNGILSPDKLIGLLSDNNQLLNPAIIEISTNTINTKNSINIKHDAKINKIVYINDTYFAIETEERNKKVLIINAINGDIKKIIRPTELDIPFNETLNPVSGFMSPYLYFSFDRVDLTDVLKAPAAINKKRGAIPKSVTIAEKISSFNYKALLISNQNYSNGINTLQFPSRDAKRLKNVLKTEYNFDTKDIIHLQDATRFDIINTLDSLASSITSKDNLLIFYAGHGVFDENLKKGYWLPVDASANRKNNWVSNSDIRDYITAFKSQHTLLISDACFSGSIFEYKQRSLSKQEKAVTEKLLRKKSRKAMTSGLNKSVPDESIFIKYLIKALKDNKKAYLRAGELYNDIREAVMANTDNNPQFEVIKNAEHEGGEFIFLKRE